MKITRLMWMFSLLTFTSCGTHTAPNEAKQEDQPVERPENSISFRGHDPLDGKFFQEVVDSLRKAYNGNAVRSIPFREGSGSGFVSIDRYNELPVFLCLRDEKTYWQVQELSYPPDAIAEGGFPVFEVVFLGNKMYKKENILWTVVHVTGQSGVGENGERSALDINYVLAFSHRDKEIIYTRNHTEELMDTYTATRANGKSSDMSVFELNKNITDAEAIDLFIASLFRGETDGSFSQVINDKGKLVCCMCPPYAWRFTYRTDLGKWTGFYDMLQDSRDWNITSITRKQKSWVFTIEEKYMETKMHTAVMDTITVGNHAVLRVEVKSKDGGSSLFVYEAHTAWLNKNPEECDLEEEH